MDEEPDAAALLPDAIEAFDDETAVMPDWAGSLIKAWSSLQNDRHRYDSGGCSGIYYSSISAYAADHGIGGEAFAPFEMMLRGMDDEYVVFTGEKAREAAEAAKSERP